MISIDLEEQKAKFVFEATLRRCPNESCNIPIEKNGG